MLCYISKCDNIQRLTMIIILWPVFISINVMTPQLYNNKVLQQQINKSPNEERNLLIISPKGAKFAKLCSTIFWCWRKCSKPFIKLTLTICSVQVFRIFRTIVFEEKSAIRSNKRLYPQLKWISLEYKERSLRFTL